MKVSWNIKPEKLGKDLLNDVKATMPKVLEAFSQEVEVNARKNFIKAIPDISGDNPYVSVSRTISGKTATISCSGEQVLFAEFGAGIFNSFKEIDVFVPEHTATTSSGATYRVKGYTKTLLINARGFKAGGLEEKLPRPNGIYPLGEYAGRVYFNGSNNLSNEQWNYALYWANRTGFGSQGKNPFWVRSTTNGRKANGESNVHDRNGNVRTGVVWTQGTKPVRGLWRARQTAINKLNSGRLKIK